VKKNGFTLVETLVALFVFALLATTAVVVLGNTADAQLRLSDVSGSVQDFQRLRAAMRADFAQAAERLSRDPRGDRQPAFVSGGEDRLFAFVRRGWENPGGAPRASLQYVEYRFEDGAIVRYARPMVDGAEFGEPAVLARGITAVEVAYRDGDAWREAWDPLQPTMLPVAVRIDASTARFGTVRQLFLTQVPA
jgi:general secretion pathway protein J